MDVREKLVDVLYKADRECNNKQCATCKHQEKRFFCKIHFYIDHLIAHGVTAQEWISVKDRLPSKEEYTAKAEDGTEYYVRLLIAYKTDIVEYEIGYYDGYKWMTEMPIRLIKDVVAWMPFPNMPQPPKGE